MRIFLILFFLLSFLFSQEFQIDTTITRRPCSWNQWHPDVEYFDTLFFVVWSNGEVSVSPTLSMCRIAKNGDLIDSVAIDIPNIVGNFEIIPVCEAGDTTFIISWWDGLYPYPRSRGVILDRNTNILNYTLYPLNAGVIKDIKWDGSYFFAVFNNGDSVLLGKIDRTGNLINLLVLNQTPGNLEWEGCIEWNDSIGIVLWAKNTPLTRAAIINHAGQVLWYITINEKNFCCFDIAYLDSIFMCIFKKENTDSLFYQRFSYIGELLDYNPKFLTTTSNIYYRCRIVAGDSLFYIFWTDSLYNIWMCRVNKKGVIDTVFPIITNPAFPIYSPDADYNGENFYIAWVDKRDSSSYPYPRHRDIYGTPLNKNGIPLHMGEVISYELFTSFNQLNPFVQGTGNKFLVVWEDERKLNKDIYLKIFDENGIPLFDIPKIIAEDSLDERNIKIAGSGINYILAWEKNKDLYAQLIDSSGNPTGNPIILSNFIGLQCNSFLTYSDSIYFAVWEDQRMSGPPDIYGARVKIDGTVLDTDGILISTSPAGSFYPKISGIDSMFLVVWEDRRNGNPDIYAARVTRSGIVLDPYGIPVCTLPTYQKYPAVGKLNNKFIIIWQDLRNGTDYDLYYARVNLDGEVLEPDGNLFVSTQNDEISPFIPQTEIPFVMWYRITPAEYQFRGGFIDTSGMLSYENTLIPETSYRQHPCIFIKPDSTYFIVYERRNTNFSYKIYGFMKRFVNINEGIHYPLDAELKIPTIIKDKLILSFNPFTDSPIYIYNESGRKMMEISVKDKSLNLEFLPGGTYFIKFKNRKKFFKIIKIF